MELLFQIRSRMGPAWYSGLQTGHWHLECENCLVCCGDRDCHWPCHCGLSVAHYGPVGFRRPARGTSQSNSHVGSYDWLHHDQFVDIVTAHRKLAEAHSVLRFLPLCLIDYAPPPHLNELEDLSNGRRLPK